MTWAAGDYLEAAVRDLLTAADARVDATVGHAALLLACLGSPEAADRLARRWQEATERPATALAEGPVAARAWAMLFAARGGRPDWAGALPPLDLDAEEVAHRAHLTRRESPIPPGLLGDGAPGRILSGLAAQLEQGGQADPLRVLAAEAQDRARAAEQGVTESLAHWADRAALLPRPPVELLAGCRHLAPLLLGGALRTAFGLAPGWAGDCADQLTAALGTRYRSAAGPRDWSGLVERIMELRAMGPPPAPATAEQVAGAERLLGVELPADYRQFLRTSNGLPAHEVFPRLLGVAELSRRGSGHVLVSEPGAYGVVLLARGESGWRAVEWDRELGATVHPSFRALLTEHLRLLTETGE
ncbi:SMI1/KNR4 family protein [Amycolatopsis aidingensis]|uniref:SMI1/KNR4 family protein n=1 Tax=Amycolatopsis aidingensis TaxID=2842453 RepID=UPI001C0E76BC|nr:SMI1/KNR4 family protein [Amycolatopsis aidingensis]